MLWYRATGFPSWHFIPDLFFGHRSTSMESSLDGAFGYFLFSGGYGFLWFSMVLGRGRGQRCFARVGSNSKQLSLSISDCVLPLRPSSEGGASFAEMPRCAGCPSLPACLDQSLVCFRVSKDGALGNPSFAPPGFCNRHMS